MPHVRVYRCKKDVTHEWETLDDPEPLAKCPTCGGDMEKIAEYDEP